MQQEVSYYRRTDAFIAVCGVAVFCKSFNLQSDLFGRSSEEAVFSVGLTLEVINESDSFVAALLDRWTRTYSSSVYFGFDFHKLHSCRHRMVVNVRSLNALETLVNMSWVWLSELQRLVDK